MVTLHAAGGRGGVEGSTLLNLALAVAAGVPSGGTRHLERPGVADDVVPGVRAVGVVEAIIENCQQNST